MSNVELLQVMIIFTVLWYVGMALVEETRSMKKPMATRNKNRG
jgi:cell division protein FtsN